MLVTGGVNVREVKCPVSWHSSNLKNVHSREIPVMRGRRERELIPHIGFAGLLELFLDIVSLKRDHACFVDVFVGGENARKVAQAVHVSKIRFT